MSNGRITNSEIRSEQDLINLGADRTYLPHSSKIYIEKTGIEQRLDEYLVKNHFVATRDPDELDDSTRNFEVGSRWVNSLSEKIFTLVNDTASGAVWTQGGGGIETFTTILDAEAREDNEDFDLIYVVENETIYRYSASGLSAEPVDGFYILGDDYAVDGRWRGLAGRYIFEGIGGIDTYVTVSEAGLRERNEDYDLIYVVETESIYRYSASGLSYLEVDDIYILSDTYVSDGRWKAIAGNSIYGDSNKGIVNITDEINSASIGTFNTYYNGYPLTEAFFWDESEQVFNLLSTASLNLDIQSSGSISYDTTSFVFDSGDYIILQATYSGTNYSVASEYDSGWVSVSSINHLPISGYHRVDLPTGFNDDPAGYSLKLDDGVNTFPADLASRLIFDNLDYTHRVTIDTEGLDSTDKFRLVCSKSARPTGTFFYGGDRDAVVGSVTQYNMGLATHTSLQDAHDDIALEGGKIILISSISESVTWTKSNITLEGKGRSTQIIGTITLSGNGNNLKQFRIIGDLNVSGDINYFAEMWLSSTSALNNNGNGNYSNYILEA